jgi:hypothetical protein
MPTNSQRHDMDLPQPGDRIAELFGVPAGQRCPPRDASPATPQPPGRLHAVLSWLWQFFLEGFARYGFAMNPGFPEPSDLSDLFGPPRRSPAAPAPMAPPDQSLWQFEALVRQHPPSSGNGGSQYLPRTPWQSVPLGRPPGRSMSAHLEEDRTIADVERGSEKHSPTETREV